MTKSTQVGAANKPALAPIELNGTKKICPMCPQTTIAPYGPITITVGCCSKPCSEKWDLLPFDEKQRLLDIANGTKPHIVAQAA